MSTNKLNWLAGILALPCILSCTGKENSNLPYNVIFIAVDDLRPELGCYGNQHMVTPNIDRLARNGVVFERAFCQSPICMSSRSSLLTGKYPIAHRLYSNLSVKELDPETVTINKLFQNNGYEVHSIGKVYHHGEDHRSQFGGNHINPNEGRSGKSGYLTAEAISRINDHNRGLAWEIGPDDGPQYADEFTADWTVKKLDELSKSDKPFFLAVGFSKPHLPFNAPKKYWGLYDHNAILLTKTPDYPKNGSLYGKHNSPEIRHYVNIPKGEKAIPDSTARMLKHGYYACISLIDDQIGKILDMLEEKKMMKNTIIVLWGDHGFKFGEYGMWTKHTNFELDTRVPLIISAPGYTKNGKANSFVELVDIYPTLAELCNLTKPAHLHGKSLKPALENPYTMIKDAAYTIWPSYQAPRTDPEKAIIGFSVRTGQYRYTEWIHNASGELLDKELYDHSNDPDETKNVVSESKYTGDLHGLNALIEDYRNTYSGN